MVQLSAFLISVVPGSRVAQFAIDGRGICRVPLSKEQAAELEGCEEKRFTITVAEETATETTNA